MIGNGDVTSAASAKKLMDASGCDGIMIGRGGLGNPWIYKSIEAEFKGELAPAAPTLDEKKQAALKHLELEIQHDVEKVAVLKFRRIACWYLQGVPGAAELRARINTLQTADEMRDAILSFGK